MKKICLLFCFPKGLYVGTVSFGGDVPVDSANVVAILVGSHVVELQARTFEDRVKVTLHLAVDSLTDLYFVVAKFLN